MNRGQLRIVGSGDAGRPAMPPLCERPDLEAWGDAGGALPRSLARHIRTCPSCAERVRRISEVQAGLTLLRTLPVPVNLQARSNGRALRMLRKAARASAAARRLLAARPELTPWQRAQLHLTRLSMGMAAAILILLIRTGVATGFQRTEATGQLLVSQWERHVDPNGEWFNPRTLA